MAGSSGSHFEAGKRPTKRRANGGTASAPPVQLAFLATADLKPDPRNPRKHSRAQIRAIARSMETFGFNAPILIDKNKQIIAAMAATKRPSSTAACKSPSYALNI
jgi:ParB-like nuclease domain